MERRVIKINLVAAICLIVLVITTIVGGVFLIKKIREIHKNDANITVQGFDYSTDKSG